MEQTPLFSLLISCGHETEAWWVEAPQFHWDYCQLHGNCVRQVPAFAKTFQMNKAHDIFPHFSFNRFMDSLSEFLSYVHFGSGEIHGFEKVIGKFFACSSLFWLQMNPVVRKINRYSFTPCFPNMFMLKTSFVINSC